MPHEGYASPVMNDGRRFHLDMPVSELAERDTRAIEASVVSSTPPIAETADGVTHKTRPTLTEPNGAQGLEPPNPNPGIRPTEVRRLAREGLEATSCQTEPWEKNQDEPQQPCPTPLRSGQGHLDPSCLILTSSQTHRISNRGEANRPPKLIERLGHLPGGGLRSSGMPHEGSTDPVSG